MHGINFDANHVALQRNLISGCMYSRRLYQPPRQFPCTQSSQSGRGITKVTLLDDDQSTTLHVMKN